MAADTVSLRLLRVARGADGAADEKGRRLCPNRLPLACWMTNTASDQYQSDGREDPDSDQETGGARAFWRPVPQIPRADRMSNGHFNCSLKLLKKGKKEERPLAHRRDKEEAVGVAGCSAFTGIEPLSPRTFAPIALSSSGVAPRGLYSSLLFDYANRLKETGRHIVG